MRVAGDLRGPATYDGRWPVLAVVCLGLVALYYLLVLVWSRPRKERPAALGQPRAATLRQLEQIEASVTAGQLSFREGHQRLSEAVRAFVGHAAGVPASTMTLADLEREGPERLAQLIALIYVPSFGHDDDLARARLDEALQDARQLVTTWT